MSRRKPMNDRAGYVASRRNPITGGFLVLYRATEAGLDASDGPWATVCETHGTICNHSSLAKARAHLPTADWCEACQELAVKRTVTGLARKSAERLREQYEAAVLESEAEPQCQICGKPINSAELCAACAKDREPFPSGKWVDTPRGKATR